LPPKRLQRPLARENLVPPSLGTDGDPATDRAISTLTSAIQRLEAQIRPRVSMVADLVVGTNRIAHGLGRRPVHCIITPTTASAAFAYALTGDTDEAVAVISVVGVDQVGAGVVFE
jgi:hypothetical protein